MKLTHIRIKDFRSFSGDHEFDVSSGVNYFVGPNNCGKSNLLRAIELALDPDAQYASQRDRPANAAGIGQPRVTRLTLTFHVGRTASEETLLTRAETYEHAVRKGKGGKTYADERVIRMVTSFAGGVRQSTFAAKGAGATILSSDRHEHRKLEEQFWKVLRFAVVHSGEDLESLLKGKFREILRLVIADHLGDEFASAEAARAGYVSALQAELLDPLRTQILERVSGMFPEITFASLIPDVPSVGSTLSSVDVQLGDALTTRLAAKGTGVRGAVLVSMLQYLAEQSRRSLVLAVEEPEAFLHPAAQEVIRGELERLATKADVTLLVTTHSPYVISRSSEAMVTELRKVEKGMTTKARVAAGCDSRAELLGSLYRDPELASVIERSLDISPSTKVVVVTEGYTDDLFLRLCCTAIGREDLLEGMQFIVAGAAARVVAQAVLAEAATGVPVIALVDNDAQGRAARDKLKSFNWDTNTRILSLASWPGACKNHDTEIEDLLPRVAVDKLVARLGEDAGLDGKERCASTWHLRLSKAWKEAAISSLASVLPKADAGGMVWLAEELHTRAGKISAATAKQKAHLASVGAHAS